MKYLIFLFILLFFSCGTNEVPKEFVSTKQVWQDGSVTTDTVTITYNIYENRNLLKIYSFRPPSQHSNYYKVINSSGKAVHQTKYFDIQKFQSKTIIVKENDISVSPEERTFHFLTYRKKFVYSEDKVEVKTSLGKEDFETVITYLK